MDRSDRDLLAREQELLGVLAWACSIQRPQMPDGFVYASLEDVVLRHGRVFSHVRAAQRTFRRRPMPKQCFINAYRAAMQFRTLSYCEGYAMPPIGIPCLHAWLVDRAGKVLDPTWDVALAGSSKGCVYIGLPFDLSWLRAHTDARKGEGVLSPGSRRSISYEESLAAEALLDLGLPVADDSRLNVKLPALLQLA